MKIDLVNNITSDINIKFIDAKSLKKNKHYKTLNLAGFSAKQDSLCFLHEVKILACGIESSTPENIRSACSAAIKSLQSSNYKSVSFPVTKGNMQAVVEGVILGGYEFNTYKSEPQKT